MTITANEMKVLKMNLLGGMNTYLKEKNEVAYGEWIEWVFSKNEPTEKDLEMIANDEWLWKDACRQFGSIVDYYGLG